jgi:hypothetical protein
LQVASDDERQSQGHLWTGGLLYLILLEHVGWYLSSRKAEPRPSGSGEAFKRSLDMFGTPMSADDRAALWVLRNSFAHDFSLAKSRGRQQFLLEWTLDSQPAVTLPAVRWDGVGYGSPAHPTKVNLRAVEDLAEGVVRKIGNLAKAQPQGLYVLSDISDDEFDRRFRLHVSRPRSPARRRFVPVPTAGSPVTGTGSRRVPLSRTSVPTTGTG